MFLVCRPAKPLADGEHHAEIMCNLDSAAVLGLRPDQEVAMPAWYSTALALELLHAQVGL